MSEPRNIGWKVRKDGSYFVRVGPGMIHWGTRAEGLLFEVSHLADKLADFTDGKVEPQFAPAAEGDLW